MKKLFSVLALFLCLSIPPLYAETFSDDGGQASGRYDAIYDGITSTGTYCITSPAGVSELNGAIALGQYDALTLMYVGDRWVQTAPVSNN